LQAMVKDQLVHNIREIHHGHLSTGIVGTYFLFQALTQNLATDLAYEILTIKDYPGYEYMLSYNSPLQAKATTLWEDWGGKSSLCHPVQGCIVSFLYESLAGIQPTLVDPGFKKIVIAPQFVPGLHSVNCQLESFYGLIRSKWEIKDNQLLMYITVPINTKAEIRIPTQISLQIFEGNRLIETCQEIKEIISPQLKHPWISFILGSGDYFFHFSQAYLD
jgi:alpha-L-rhamnosidase